MVLFVGIILRGGVSLVVSIAHLLLVLVVSRGRFVLCVLLLLLLFSSLCFLLRQELLPLFDLVLPPIGVHAGSALLQDLVKSLVLAHVLHFENVRLVSV